MSSLFTVSVFSPHDASWRWYEPDMPAPIRWLFTNEDLWMGLPAQSLGRRILRRLPLGRIWGAWRCLRQAKAERTDVIVAHSVKSTLWIALGLRLLRLDIPLICFSCHFEYLPRWYAKWFWQLGFQRVQRFLVHSHLEQRQYAEYFNFSLERFQLVRWGVNPPVINPDAPAPLATPYICSVGKSGRDYRTLLAAMAQLPDLTLVLVAQPYNLTNLTIPANVKVFCNIPEAEYLNILQHSLFLAIPLHHQHTPCGLMTIVAAMLSGKAIVITKAEAIQDYLPPDYPAAQIEPQDVEGWVKMLKLMVENTELRQRCEQMGQEFANRYCSHSASMLKSFEVLQEFGLTVTPSSEHSEPGDKTVTEVTMGKLA